MTRQEMSFNAKKLLIELARAGTLTTAKRRPSARELECAELAALNTSATKVTITPAGRFAAQQAGADR